MTGKEEYLQSDYDIARCSYKLLESAIFTSNKDYVRRQIIYGLLQVGSDTVDKTNVSQGVTVEQEDDAPTLHLIAAFLLFDGRGNDETFEMMRVEGVFPRLVELIQARQREHEPQLHRLLLELMYGMSRMQRLTWEDLCKALGLSIELNLQADVQQRLSTTLSCCTSSRSSNSTPTTPAIPTTTTSSASSYVNPKPPVPSYELD